MHIPTTITTTLLALLATTTALTPAWNVTLTRTPTEQTVSAQFVSDSYPSGIFSECVYVYATQQEEEGCSENGFGYEYDGETIKLEQVLQKPNPMTVFGEAALMLEVVDDGMEEKTYKGNAIVDVTRAIA
ncbi:hypothetical protein BDW02DRAFT_543046 [Decorospora gaudefroyi]|uniref:Uncharacterized protein n=1 Tax=Decorospora gaudefroyi TaxID=184978 RepID=A0A6A5KPE5_9PLEO|nr:hypothetical protein BDW02DRAFT_543046 [Decorospora gaudefroyi]